MEKMTRRQIERGAQAILVNIALENARPWEPISEDYISTKELLLVLGGDPKREYRKLLFYCGIATQPGDNNHLLPSNLKDCFREKVVRIAAFKTRYEGASTAKVEYRVAIADLYEPFRVRASEIVKGRNNEELRLRKTTVSSVRKLALHTGKTITEIMEELDFEMNRDEISARSERSGKADCDQGHKAGCDTQGRLWSRPQRGL